MYVLLFEGTLLSFGYICIICMIQICSIWHHKWQSAQWRALSTKITEINLFAFTYRLFHENFSSILGAKMYYMYTYFVTGANWIYFIPGCGQCEIFELFYF